MGLLGLVLGPLRVLACPVYVEHDVGSLLIPVGPPPDPDADPEVVFAGLARIDLDDRPADVQTRKSKLRRASSSSNSGRIRSGRAQRRSNPVETALRAGPRGFAPFLLAG